ncbi:MAG TPA: Ig-like domain-containing protein [Polyangiaceae bacterium]|nr:Ig-like domain-containing protein [Polyangiaceae bacterium]
MALGLGACDVSEPDPPRALGPDVRLLAIYPENGEGTECAPHADDACGVPVNATLTLRFDRFLNPASVNRQAIRVFTGNPADSPTIPFDVNYDPLERVVEFRMPSGYGFVPRALYQIELVVPEGPDDFGIRAFDGAPLAEGDVPLAMSFLTSRVAEQLPVASVPSCEEIVRDVLADASLGNCAGGECHHSSPQHPLGGAPEGLWLDGRQNLRITAIGRVAHETEFGDSSGVPLQDSPRFGVQMPIIDPKSPGNSYLLYKLLRDPKNFEPCADERLSPVCSTPADPSVSSYDKLPLGELPTLVPPAEESIRLREWFVRGEVMPFPRGNLASGVSLQGLRAITAFIAAGADCSE